MMREWSRRRFTRSLKISATRKQWSITAHQRLLFKAHLGTLSLLKSWRPPHVQNWTATRTLKQIVARPTVSAALLVGGSIRAYSPSASPGVIAIRHISSLSLPTPASFVAVNRLIRIILDLSNRGRSAAR